uniref:Uncharacterized protein n=1 Tax=Lactuca sativa TaxID=4236 RepID=A0A9R1X378_LACSA|nr:hypothetical protein LSAT_V11C700375950 [Lactuca sativa]
MSKKQSQKLISIIQARSKMAFSSTISNNSANRSSKQGRIRCDCDDPISRWTSRKPKNPGRRFIGCPDFKIPYLFYNGMVYQIYEIWFVPKSLFINAELDPVKDVITDTRNIA